MNTFPRRRLLLGALATTLVTGALTARALPARAAGPHSGTIHIAVAASLAVDHGKQSLVVTGAFADAGAFVQGSPSKAKLGAGSFTANDAQGAAREGYLFSHLNKFVNPHTCAMNTSYTDIVTLTDGTGAYAGISGTVQVTTTDIGVFPKRADGSCNLSSNSAPIDFLSIGRGTGHVTLK